MKQRLSFALHAVSVRRGDKWALRDVSLELKAGERWALIGGNGAGKTQLMKLIGTDVWPTPSGREKRVYRVGRKLVDVIEAKQRIAYIGAELQDKYARYDWNPTVEGLLATGLHRTDLLQRPVTAPEGRLIAAMLARTGLQSLAARPFLSLSYGQKRLALLARALIQGPDWLLLDEFYNGLDMDFRARVDDVLEAARRGGQSWVVSAHRALDVPRGTSGLIELGAGRVRSIKRLDDADLRRLAAQADESPRRRLHGGLGSFDTGGAGRAGRSAASTGKERGGVVTRGSTARRMGKVLVRIARADVYVDYRPVLDGLEWTLREGQQWAVFGGNGAGKSTFLKLLYGDLSPALGGRIERAGFPRGTPISEWKRQVGLVSPELQTDYAVNVTVLELVASGRHASIGLSDAMTAEDAGQARRWLEFFSLRSFARRQPRQLSYGQLRRALFARAMMGNPRMLLLDEPLTGLDPRQRTAMKRLLEKLIEQRVSLVIAVHHPEDLPRGMTHALRLHNRTAVATDFHSET